MRALLSLTVVGVASLGVSTIGIAEEDPVAPANSVGSDLPIDDVAVRGEEAVEMLAAAGLTAEVAAAADLSEEELVDELRADSTLFVTDQGQVGYADIVVPELLTLADPDAASADLAAEALSSPVNVCDLQSRPGSSRVLYLDFTGHTTPTGQWGNGSPLVSQRFTRDSSPSFSDVERAEIFEIWRRVSEDFAPFNLNVTTRDPGTAGLRRTSTSDAAYGQRMVISPTNWTGSAGTLGIAYLNVFDAPLDYSAFVFVSPTSTPNAATIAEAVSHEAGHTLGLSHDGVTGQSYDYYVGHGRWAPIMGYPLGKPVTQWSKGEYAAASQLQDDLAILGSYAAPIADDWPNTAGAAPLIPSRTIGGVIGAGGDVDVMRFTAAGNTTISVGPTGPGSNLRARVELRNAGGTVIASGESGVPSSTGGSWTVDLVAPALAVGDYTITISPIGYLDASTGFTAYGSLGAYEVNVRTGTPLSIGPGGATAPAQRLSTLPSC